MCRRRRTAADTNSEKHTSSCKHLDNAAPGDNENITSRFLFNNSESITASSSFFNNESITACFFNDSIILINAQANNFVGNSTDVSATGMTVEKCVQLAQKQGMRYAGVEFASECFIGNTLHSTTKASDGDCNSVCAGAKTELCGGGNRVQVYEDTTWSDPTLDQLTAVLVQYNTTLFQLTTLTNQYQQVMQQWADQEKNGGAKKKRWWQVKRSLTITQLQEQVSSIESQYPNLQAVLEQAAQNGGVLYVRAESRDVVRPNQANPFVDPPTLAQAQQSFDIPLSHINDVRSSIDSDLASINSAISAHSTTPLINAAESVQVAESAASVIGTVTGSISVIALVFLHLHPTGNPNDGGHGTGTPPTTVGPTATSSTTTSSSTPTATDYLVVAADGVSVAAFDAYSAQFDPRNPIINNVFAIARVASLNDTGAKEIANSPLVGSVTFNDLQDSTGEAGAVSRKRQDTGSSLDTEIANVTLSGYSSLERRVGPAVPQPTALNLIAEPGNVAIRGRKGSPFLAHLRMLSQTWFDNILGDYNGQDYVYENNAGKGAYIYVVDNGVDYTHPEIAKISKEPQIIVNGYKPPADHGTKVASVALGKNVGVASSATLISVAFDPYKEDEIIDAFYATYKDITSKNRQGNAIVVMSFNGKAQNELGQNRLGQNYWWAKSIRKFIDEGIVPVCSAGNNGIEDIALLSNTVPGAYSFYFSDFMAVGAVDSTGKKTAFSPKCNAADSTSTCLPVYAMGQGVGVALLGGQVGFDSGTSFSAPAVAGLAAYLMKHPNPAISNYVNNGPLGQLSQRLLSVMNDWAWSRNSANGKDFPNTIWNGCVLNYCNMQNSVPRAATRSTEEGTQKVSARQDGAQFPDPSDTTMSVPPATCPTKAA
ncbi:hypothetical protein NQ176_g6293 [Zarea fungicola]|uniref:Uncharacterized protein n=1 Tax=Zarea fungicola TaxID=93591 RepID=A0ACC1N505_9HYPO|nr:hypothetical protein NQ176_g6293 [Lecanicillium fungicola]